MIRDDTPVMLSPKQYETFVRPYDQRLLDAFGGCIHFCGRGDHFVSSMVASEHLYGLHVSQPELNDMGVHLGAEPTTSSGAPGPRGALRAVGGAHRGDTAPLLEQECDKRGLKLEMIVIIFEG